MTITVDVRSGRVLLCGKPVPYRPSPNISGARMEPRLLVLHDTAGSSLEGAVSWFENPKSRVSAHLVVDRDGTLVQCVLLDHVAWHTAPSDWNGQGNCNGYAIGIEIVNPGGLDKNGYSAGCKKNFACIEKTSPKHSSRYWAPYSEAQLNVVEGLVAAISAAYRLEDLVGHHDISPKRKEDPTPLMPWERMRKAFKASTPAGYANLAGAVRAAQQRLAELHYAPGAADGIMGPRTRGAVRTFQEQNHLAITGELDRGTLDLLLRRAPVPVSAVGADSTLTLPAPKPMPLGNRAELTVAELRARGSGTLMATLVARWGLLLLLGPELGQALVDMAAMVDNVERGLALLTRLEALLPVLAKVPAWALTPAGIKTLVLAGLLGAGWSALKVVEWRRVRDAQTGNNARV